MKKINFINPDKIKSWSTLKKTASKGGADFKNVLTPEFVKKSFIEAGGGLTYYYGAKGITPDVITALAELAEEQQLIGKYRRLLNGEIMNTGENRMVLHHLTRGRLGEDLVRDGKNLRSFYLSQQEKIAEFAGQVHSGAVKGSTGKSFDTVVQIGIGGSDLGPRALYLALEPMAVMKARFISNVDPDDAVSVLNSINPETTLFIAVSKSGTTQETLTNMEFARETMKSSGIPGLEPSKHMIAVTSETSPLAGSPDYLRSFYIDDFIGGRYSSTSAVGGAVLSLAFGPETFSSLLQGAAEADRLALEDDITKNPSMMDACIGIYERNFLGYPMTAVLPYSQALQRFPAHLQQLDMESNGKSVNRFGEPLNYQTGPVVFGEPGTNGQHSFYQLLHQGTDIVPLQFIGFTESQRSKDLTIDGSTSQEKLNANLAAQIVAFALGKDDENPNKRFAGNRPSSLIHGKKLTPEALGALLAHFENKIMFQGFLWNINSFDQEGVQLGKVLAKKILSGGEADPLLDFFYRL